MTYDDEIFEIISRYSSHINYAGSVLDIDPGFIASVIAEEQDDHANRDWISRSLAEQLEIDAVNTPHNVLHDDYSYISEAGDRFPDGRISIPTNLPSTYTG